MNNYNKSRIQIGLKDDPGAIGVNLSDFDNFPCGYENRKQNPNKQERRMIQNEDSIIDNIKIMLE